MARSEQQHSLSNPYAIVYPPQFLPSQQFILENQSTESPTHPPLAPGLRNSQSPKEGTVLYQEKTVHASGSPPNLEQPSSSSSTRAST